MTFKAELNVKAYATDTFTVCVGGVCVVGDKDHTDDGSWIHDKMWTLLQQIT